MEGIFPYFPTSSFVFVDSSNNVSGVGKKEESRRIICKVKEE